MTETKLMATVVPAHARPTYAVTDWWAAVMSVTTAMTQIMIAA